MVSMKRAYMHMNLTHCYTWCRSLVTENVGDLLQALVAAEPPVNTSWTSLFQDICLALSKEPPRVLSQLPVLYTSASFHIDGV